MGNRELERRGTGGRGVNWRHAIRLTIVSPVVSHENLERG